MALIGFSGGAPTSELVRQIYSYDVATNTPRAGTTFNMASVSTQYLGSVFVYSGKKGSVSLPTSLHITFINEDGTIGSDHSASGTVDLSQYMGAMILVYNYDGTITYSET